MQIWHATTGDGVGFSFTHDPSQLASVVLIKWDHDDTETWKPTIWPSGDYGSPLDLALDLASYYATGEDDDELAIAELKLIEQEAIFTSCND